MSKQRLLVVGNGMAGGRFVEDLIARGGNDRFNVTVFGDEPHGNYNRILLSSVLAGEYRAGDIFLNPLEWYPANGVTLYAGTRVTGIDTDAQTVSVSGDRVHAYDELVIATGSSAVIPPIQGVFDNGGRLNAGVFLFRTLDDCDRILERTSSCHTAAVIGGGLLGLEAAKGLAQRGLDVHVVHLRSFLMEMQLDPEGGLVLSRQLARLGLHVRLATATTAIVSDGAGVQEIIFDDGSNLRCDMVVIAAGIRPNVELATRTGLAVNRGILVGDDLACPNVDHVYAIGECAEHRGQVYGLVGPAWEQAALLADRLMGRALETRYEGTRVSTKLKVAGVDLAIMGLKDPAEEDDEVVTYAEPSRGIYKKLIVRDDRIAGAIVMGDATILPGIRQAFDDATRLGGQRGELFFPVTSSAAYRPNAADLPDTARICDCNAVTKAAIIQAVLSGASSLAAVSERTRACTGCGSCRPEVERIVALACAAAVDPDVLAPAPPAEHFEPVESMEP